MLSQLIRSFRLGRRQDDEVVPESSDVPATFQPFSEEFIEDPYRFFKALRQKDPIHRAESGAWVISRYEDVKNALSDRRLSNAPSPYAVVNRRNSERFVCADVANNLIAFMDMPDHAKPRSLIARAFHQHMRGSLPDLDHLAVDCLKALPDRGKVELLESFATPFALQVIAKLMGIPKGDFNQIKSWTNDFFYLFSLIPSEEVRVQLDRSLSEFRSYFLDLIQQRRSSPENDLISALLQSAQSVDTISDAQLVDNCMLLFADGVENVDSGILNAVLCLLLHPEELSKFRSQPELIDKVVEECLRFESPAQFIGRVPTEDIELHGNKIRAGTPILLLLASANRDEDVFPHPDRFDVSRMKNPYLSFGSGKHSCVGGALVKVEYKAALNALFAKYRKINLVENNPKWSVRLGHRWLECLDLRLG
ncbi:MAG: cytochrome P450 [Verrucomicrobiota bacterium]